MLNSPHLVIVIEEVETWIGAFVLLDSLGDAGELVDACAGIVNGGTGTQSSRRQSRPWEAYRTSAGGRSTREHPPSAERSVPSAASSRFRQHRQANSGIIVEPVWFRLCRVRCWKERSGRRWATNPRQPTPRARCSWKLPANSTACRGMLVPSQRSSWPFCSPQRASH